MCESCELVSLWELAADRLISCEYDDSYFTGDRGTGYEDYVGRERAIREKTAEAILRILNESFNVGGTLLDVGCGAGYLVAAARRMHFNAVGIDTSPAAVALSRVLGLDKGSVRCSSMATVSGKFDAVTLCDVIEHIPNPVGALRRAAELVVDGGILFILTPRFGGPLYRRQGSQYIQFRRDHIYYFTESTLVRVAEEAGLVDWCLFSFSALLRALSPPADYEVCQKYTTTRDHVVLVARQMRT